MSFVIRFVLMFVFAMALQACDDGRLDVRNEHDGNSTPAPTSTPGPNPTPAPKTISPTFTVQGIGINLFAEDVFGRELGTQLNGQ